MYASSLRRFALRGGETITSSRRRAKRLDIRPCTKNQHVI